MNEFSISSELAAPAERVWRHATSPDELNREFRPLLRMTFPRDVDDLEAAVRPGEPLFRSWLLLGGVPPVEYDDLVFETIEPGRRFLERSSMFTQREWEHERVVEPRPDGGCRIGDRVRFVPRARWLAPLSAPIVRAVFRLRHRNLRRLFGEAGADGG